MQIAPPFGYQEIVPLRRNEKVRLPAAGEVPKFAQALNAIPISYTEFTLVARQYPIVFTSGDNGQSFNPVAVLGVTSGENLFVAGGRGPRARTCRPMRAAIRSAWPRSG